jgi:hypothetical protein
LNIGDAAVRNCCVIQSRARPALDRAGHLGADDAVAPTFTMKIALRPPNIAPRTRWLAQALGNISDARLMLRLNRGLGPLSGCRWFNAV